MGCCVCNKYSGNSCCASERCEPDDCRTSSGNAFFPERNQLAAFCSMAVLERMARLLAPMLEEQTGLPVVGFLPYVEDASFESRHLGLVTAQEVGALSEKVDRLADTFLQHVDLEQVLRIAATADSVAETIKSEAALKSPDCSDSPQFPAPDKECLRIGIAQDTAFCFYYEENKRALRQQGLELVEFSPMEDKKLPEGICGLYLGGGYPELHAGKLSENSRMRHAIFEAVRHGMPTIAECGGFLYLQKELEDADGQVWEMTGVLDGSGFRTNRLQRFGYAVMTAKENSMLFEKGESIPVHEFHYWVVRRTGQRLK